MKVDQQIDIKILKHLLGSDDNSRLNIVSIENVNLGATKESLLEFDTLGLMTKLLDSIPEPRMQNLKSLAIESSLSSCQGKQFNACKYLGVGISMIEKFVSEKRSKKMVVLPEDTDLTT